MGLGVQVSVGLGFRGLWFLGAEASAREVVTSSSNGTVAFAPLVIRDLAVVVVVS